MGYSAGQYVVLDDPAWEKPPRSYSIANAPARDGHLRFLVARTENGITSAWLNDRLRTGDALLIDGPYGTFTADPAFDGPLLYLAGGWHRANSRAAGG